MQLPSLAGAISSMPFANKRKKSSTTDLPASLREELGLGDGGRGQERRGGQQIGAGHRRGGVVGRKDARKAERRDKKMSRSRPLQQAQSHQRPQQHSKPPPMRPTERLVPKLNERDIGKRKEFTDHKRASNSKDDVHTGRGQRKHVGKDETTALQRLMNHSGSTSRSRVEPLRKKRKRIPLSAVEQQEEDEIAWLEAHIGGSSEADSKIGSKKAKGAGYEDESEGVDGGEDGLDDLLDDLDRFYPGMYDGGDGSEEDESEAPDPEDSLEGEIELESEGEGNDVDGTEAESAMSEMIDSASSTGDDDDPPALTTVRHEANEAISTGRYIPPALREKAAKTASSDTEEMQKLRRQAKGLLNRLGEGNLESIVVEMMESLYHQYSRANVTDVLTTLIIQTVSSSSNLVDTFVILHAALVASLHRLVGLEFGAHFLQTLVGTWQRIYSEARDRQIQDSEGVEEIGKEAKNSILLLADMYNLGVVACPLMFDLIKVILGIEEGKVTKAMTEIDVELLLRIVKTSGNQLRHDDPTSLKTIIQLAKQSAEVGPSSTLSSRSKFMLEALEDVKNSRNKASANQGLEQQSIARMKKFLAGLSKRRTVRTQEPLRVGLKDLQDVDKRGKWWLVGAAWAGYDSSQKDDVGSSKAVSRQEKIEAASDDEEAKRLALAQTARQHGMNTAIRQDIFVILISSQDYLDAVEKLQSLKFKKESQRREVIRVLLHCIGSEVNFNPYYVVLASRLAVDDIGTKYTLQYCLWDFLRELGEKGVGGRSIVERDGEASDDEDSLSAASMTEERIANVSRAYGWWIAKGAMTLSAMKVIDFTTLKSRAVHFLQQLFIHIFLSAQTTSPTLTFRLSSSQGKKDGPYVFGQGDSGIDQSAKEAIESVFVKGTLSNALLCKGIFFFLERKLKATDCLHVGDSLGATPHAKKQLLWARGVAKQVVKVGALSKDDAN